MMTLLTHAPRALRFPIGATITLAGLSRDPYPLFAQLQRAEPVSWIASLGMWYVTRSRVGGSVSRRGNDVHVAL